MRSILRMGLAVAVATVLAVTAAWAVEYDEIFELTERGVAERTIIQLIVDDGRAFDMSAEELADLRAAGVSENVINAMLDPAVGRAFLEGTGGYTAPGSGSSGGYSTSLDDAYQQGYNDGVNSTALVYSFGYYYGPLSRYYYADPFFYPFWYTGYAFSYWPSYYSYWYRPYYPCYYAYPYNYYGYSSYYCHSYYDPGYWASNGYAVQPGYGRTVWDNGPRFRDGGIVPPKGGRPAGSAATTSRLAEGSAGRMRNPSSPPAIREAELARTPTSRGSTRAIPGPTASRSSNGRSGRNVDAPTVRTPSSRSNVSDVRRSNGSDVRVIRGGTKSRSGAPSASATRSSSGRPARSERVTGSESRRMRDGAERVSRGGGSARGGSSASAGRAARRTSDSPRVIRGGRDYVADGQVSRSSGARSDARVISGRGNSGSRSAAPQSVSRGGSRGSSSAPSSGMSRGGGGGGGSRGGGGGGARGGGGGSSGSHSRSGGGGGGRGR